MKRGHSIDSILQPLEEKPFQAYLSDAFQIADILEWVLDQVGPSYVIQTSFSISEEYLRRLHGIREKGLITGLDVILDFKATNKTVDLWYFLSAVADRALLANNHSKIMLIASKSGRRIVVITSQNLTRGNRNESAFVAESDELFSTLFAQINNLIENSIPLNEILGGTAEND